MRLPVSAPLAPLGARPPPSAAHHRVQRQQHVLLPPPASAASVSSSACLQQQGLEGWQAAPAPARQRCSTWRSSSRRGQRPLVAAQARLSVKEGEENAQTLERAVPGSALTKDEARRMTLLMSQLQSIQNYGELLSWLSMQASGSGARSKGPGKAERNGSGGGAEEPQLQVDMQISVAVLAKAAQELEELFWNQLEDLAFEEVLSRHEARHSALDLLFSLLTPQLAELPLPVLAYCCYTASSLHDAYSEPFFKALCQQVVRSNTHSPSSSTSSAASSAAATSASSAAPTAAAGGRLALPPDLPPEEVALTLEHLCLGLANACHYAPVPMQLIAKEITVSVASCSPSSLARMLGAFMQLQHYDRAMLNAVGVYLLRPSSTTTSTTTAAGAPNGGQQPAAAAGPLNVALLEPLEAAQVAQAFAFFNVQNPAFYQVLLARMSAVQATDLTIESATSVYLTCQLIPSPSPAIPPALTEQLAAAYDAVMEDMHADQSIKTEYTTGGDLEAHVDEMEESEIVKVQEMLRYQAYDFLCMRQIWRLLKDAQRASGVVAPPSLQMECFTRATPHSPWAIVPMAIPCQALDGSWRHVALVALMPSSYCANMPNRLLGATQARLRCLQRLGWPVWPLNVGLWHEQVMDAAARAGVGEDYETASLAWAQGLSGGPHAMDANTRAKVESMVSDLGGWVQQMVEGVATLNSPKVAAEVTAS